MEKRVLADGQWINYSNTGLLEGGYMGQRVIRVHQRIGFLIVLCVVSFGCLGKPSSDVLAAGSQLKRVTICGSSAQIGQNTFGRCLVDAENVSLEYRMGVENDVGCF